MNILIIDDSIFLREKLNKAIHEIDNSIVIREAQTFHDGEAAFNSYAPDLVILEIDLLSEGGMALLGKMKASSPTSVVIIFTDYSSEEFKTKYLRGGADYFFDKCKDYREMLHIVKNLGVKNNTFNKQMAKK